MLNRRVTTFATAIASGSLACAGIYYAALLNYRDANSQQQTANPSHQQSPLVPRASIITLGHDALLKNARVEPMLNLDDRAVARAHSQQQANSNPSQTVVYSPTPHKLDHDGTGLTVPYIRQPLDLSLPPPDETTHNNSETKSTRRRTVKNNGDDTKATLDLNASIDSPEFDPDQPDKLFNRDNGLRGFMKQSWLNQNIGLQGGLAIKSERLRQNNSDLEENMAVGMGVLLAF